MLLRIILCGVLSIAPLAHAQTADAPDSDSIKAQEDTLFAAAVDAIGARDYATGFRIFQQLAKADVADAQYNLAVLYNAGLGRPINYREAAYWASLAQLQGITKAQSLAAKTKDNLTEEAQKHLSNRLQEKLASDIGAGKVQATYQMAQLTHKMMPEPDMETAYVWYSICNALAIKPCSAGLKEIGAELEPDQILKAQQRANDVFEDSVFAKRME